MTAIVGSVHDAGGGHIDIVVARDTPSYPRWGDAVIVTVLEEARRINEPCSLCDTDPRAVRSCTSEGCPVMAARAQAAEFDAVRRGESGVPSPPMYRHIVELSFDDPSPTPINLDEPHYPHPNTRWVYLGAPDPLPSPVEVGQRRRHPDRLTRQIYSVIGVTDSWCWVIDPFHPENIPGTWRVGEVATWELVE